MSPVFSILPLHYSVEFTWISQTGNMEYESNKISTSVIGFWIPIDFRGHESPRWLEQKFKIQFWRFVSIFDQYIASICFLSRNVMC